MSVVGWWADGGGESVGRNGVAGQEEEKSCKLRLWFVPLGKRVGGKEKMDQDEAGKGSPIGEG